MPSARAIPAPGSRADLLRASPPLFASSRLDRLTRVHPVVPVLVFGPVIVLCWVMAIDRLTAETLPVALGAGYLFWTLAEYWVHRKLFHLEPKSNLGARVHWIIHGVHHDHPNDPRRLVMPPIVTVPLALCFAALFVAASGLPDAWGAGAGFFTGYLLYDMLHYSLHHTRPRSRLGRLLHELHMRHHFEDDECGFGVSAPWWDTVFGTAARRRSTTRPASP
ncbi:MAG TPA: sterol desaturase family protein [Gaiellaceae bacterium]|nr:sterol desaturase family protein [Gaiellaceae bacterium]